MEHPGSMLKALFEGQWPGLRPGIPCESPTWMQGPKSLFLLRADLAGSCVGCGAARTGTDLMECQHRRRWVSLLCPHASTFQLLFLDKIYVCVYLAGRVTERERELSFTGWLPRGARQPGLGQANPGSRHSVLVSVGGRDPESLGHCLLPVRLQEQDQKQHS